ncbi:Predicted metal-dependent enzyme of the double-stranded beta helix superfamily [bacterium A37T11]|nr:Predicted metal-dependent enzyme of the double-stranded beta helix superfamily [bacterium A37T11]
MSIKKNTEKLRNFITAFAKLLELTSQETEILSQGRILLLDLLKTDDWLADDFAKPHPEHYSQYLLHADSLERFSVVSFVWGPGQQTPIHNHTVWGLVGVLRGAELSQSYIRNELGLLQLSGNEVRLENGEVESVSPNIGDIHRVKNAFANQSSISIHVYGGNIGAVKRSVYNDDGSEKVFISGYSNQFLPNIWDRSNEILSL